MATQNDTLAPPEDDLGHESSDWESDNGRPKIPKYKSQVTKEKDETKKGVIPNLSKFEVGNKVSLKLPFGKISDPYTIVKVHKGSKYDLKSVTGEIKEKVSQDEFFD